MPISVLMPALSPTMEEGNISKWLKHEGEDVKSGDVLAEIETDKAVMELEALNEGKLFKILVQDGSENIKINRVIAVIKEEEDSDQEMQDFISSLNKEKIEQNNNLDSEQKEKQNTIQNEKITLDSLKDNSDNSKKIFITPLAKKIAMEHNIDISILKGSGPRGRIIRDDIKLFLSKENSNSSKLRRNAESFREEKITNVRKIIAQRLLESKRNIPHFYLSLETRLDNLLLLRTKLNQKFINQDIRISINDFIILIAAKALKKFPEINSSWEGEKILYYNNIDISVAVSTNKGLVTPIIKNADQKNIIEISKEIKYLAQKARENKLKLEEFQGGSFSISNLGMYGINQFYAIINPPQSCILSVGKLSKKPIVVNNEIQIGSILDLSIACDHRVIDGALGAEFLSFCKELLESPELLLI